MTAEGVRDVRINKNLIGGFMKQVIGDRESVRKIREQVESKFGTVILQGRDITGIRSLLEETNPWLSGDFWDDYFSRRAQEGTAFTMMDNGKIVSLLNLSPCAAAMRRNPPVSAANGRPVCMTDIVRVNTGVISAAWTKDAYRGRGYMERLMPGALEYQNHMKIPLCIAAAEKDKLQDKFFEHFGFHYICDRPGYVLRKDVVSDEMLERASAGETVLLAREGTVLKSSDSDSLLGLAHFVNASLCRRCGLFAIRSAVYYERLHKELKNTGGDLFRIVKDGRLTGYFSYDGRGTGSIREAVFEDEQDREFYFCEEGDKKPSVMARIVNLPEMLRHISGNGKVTMAVRLTDPVIAENDGVFIWYLDRNGSRMERVEEPGGTAGAAARPEITATIGEFTAFVFEYMTLKQNAKFDSIYLAGPAWIHERF